VEKKVKGNHFELYYLDHPISKVEIVGVITSFERKAKRVVFSVDDGSGCLKCIKFCSPEEVNALPLATEVGSLVSTKGVIVLCENNNDDYGFQIKAQYIEVLSDPNAEFLHWSMCIVLDKIIREQPKPMAMNSRAVAVGAGTSSTSAARSGSASVVPTSLKDAISIETSLCIDRPSAAVGKCDCNTRSPEEQKVYDKLLFCRCTVREATGTLKPQSSTLKQEEIYLQQLEDPRAYKLGENEEYFGASCLDASGGFCTILLGILLRWEAALPEGQYLQISHSALRYLSQCAVLRV
jgi:hypothetical protein